MNKWTIVTIIGAVLFIWAYISLADFNPEKKEDKLLKKIDELELKIDSLNNRKDSIRNVIDSNNDYPVIILSKLPNGRTNGCKFGQSDGDLVYI